MTAQPELVSSRLKLRPFFSSDLPQVVELANDPFVCQYLRTFRYPFSADSAREWLNALPRQWEEGTAATFAICERQANSADAIVGTIGIVIDQQCNRAELGYWVGRRHWGRRIATDAGFSILDFAFGHLGLNRVFAECLQQNPASARVLENLGMKQEGYLAEHFRKEEHGEYADVLIFGLLRSEWNSRK